MLKIGEFSKMSHLTVKAQSLSVQRDEIDVRLSIINHILEDEEMKYQITEKNIPAATVYYSECVFLHPSSSALAFILSTKSP